MTDELYPNLHIFVSHSHKDNTFGYQLVDDLTYFLDSNKCIWYDSHGGLSGGDSWWPTIKKEIVHCNKFIVLLSREAFTTRSKWVEHEIELAWPRFRDKRLRIIPIQCDDYRIPSRLLEVKSLQILSCQTSQEYQHRFRDIIKALKLPGDPITDFLNREKLQIDNAYSMYDMNAVLKGIAFLQRYFPEAILPTMLWKQAMAFIDKGEYQNAHGTFQRGLKQVPQQASHQQWIDSYVKILLKEKRPQEAIFLMEQLRHWTPYPVYINALYKQLQYQLAEETVVLQSSSVSPDTRYSLLQDHQGTSEQATIHFSTSEPAEPQTNPSLQIPIPVQSLSLEASLPETPLEDESINTQLLDVETLSRWSRFSLLIEQNLHHPHPKEMFGTISFIGACIFNIFFLAVIALALPSSPIIGPLLVLPLAFILVKGRSIPIKAVGFLLAGLIATLWAPGGYLLTRDVTQLGQWIVPPLNLISVIEWIAFTIAGLWGFFWHWELFKPKGK